MPQPHKIWLPYLRNRQRRGRLTYEIGNPEARTRSRCIADIQAKLFMDACVAYEIGAFLDIYHVVDVLRSGSNQEWIAQRDAFKGQLGAKIRTGHCE